MTEDKINIKTKTFFYTEENPHPIWGACRSNFTGIPCLLTENGLRPLNEEELENRKERYEQFNKKCEELKKTKEANND